MRRGIFPFSAFGLLLLWWSSLGGTKGVDQVPTFSREVAPILYRNCVYCHRPGEIAPMSLLTYEEARPWAAAIRREVLEGRMPPWQPDPRWGDFANDLRLEEEEKRILVEWVNQGAPEGDPSQLPPPPRFVEGWQIGEPDLVVEMPEEFAVPASGTIEYQLIKSDYVFPEDTWVQAIEVRPGNRAVVHHAVATGVPDGDELGEASPRSIPLHLYSPGLEAIVWRPGYGKFIPKGTRIHFNLHYTAIGIESRDRTKVGFVFAREPVHTEVHTQLVMNTALAIEPGQPNHQIMAAFRFPAESRILALRPHMHLRGRTCTTTLIDGTGKRQILLHIPEWDDNWQNYYIFSRPVPAPKGSLVEFVASYDNSENNLFNPDPQARVTWGQQVWDEMMVVYMTWIENNPHNENDQEPIQVPVNQLFTRGVMVARSH